MRGGSSLIILHTLGRIFWLSLMGCESEIHHWSGPPAFAHCSLRSRRGLSLRQVGRGLISLRSGDALTAFGGGLRSAGPRIWVSLTVDRASHRLPVLSSENVGTWTPVISSQAPHHRLPCPAPRGPFPRTARRWLLGTFLMLFPRVSARRVRPGGTRCRPRGSR